MIEAGENGRRMELSAERVSIRVSDRLGQVSGVLMRPPDASALLVLGHGAGAGIHSPFMVSCAEVLGNLGIATLRYQFPYMEKGKKRPDPPAVAQATVRRVIGYAGEVAGDLPRFAGGKSFGGRMTSSAAAAEPLERVNGLVFFGFPLHPPGKPSLDRAQHLKQVGVPVLFLQGTRDALARMDLVRNVVASLGSSATLHVLDGGDHSFRTLKKLGRSEEDVWSELGEAVSNWIKAVV